MAQVTKLYTFSTGSVIIAAEHNSNFDTLYSLVNGSIDNSNISGSAAIAYAKLALTGSIINSDINTSASIANSKLDLGTIAQNITMNGNVLIGAANQGDVFYDNGTKITRLTPGTSGQFLQTQGSSANPQWATNPNLSNVLFQYQGTVSGNVGTGSGTYGESTQATNIAYASATATNRWLISSSRNVGSSYSSANPVWATKWTKISGVSTITIYAKLWTAAGSGSDQVNFSVSVGSVTGVVLSTAGSATPTWYSLTLDVSGLTNGTTYDVTAYLGQSPDIQHSVGCAAIISFGS